MKHNIIEKQHYRVAISSTFYSEQSTSAKIVEILKCA